MPAGSPTFARSRLLRALVAGALSGALLTTASIPVRLGPVSVGVLAFAALVPLLRAIDRDPGPARTALPRAALAGWVCGLLFFGVGYAWVPFARGGGPPVWFGYTLGVGLLAASLAAFALCVASLRRVGRGLALAAAPAIWIAIELLWSRGELGIAWLVLGYNLSDHPVLIRTAALGGVLALSFWIVAVSATAAAGALAPRARAAALAILLAAPPLLGVAARTPAAAPEASLHVGAVQPNLAPSERPFEERFHAALPTLMRLSGRVVEEAPGLVVWPETAFERPLGPWRDPWLGVIAGELGVPLLTGARRFGPGQPPALFNSAVLVAPDGRVRGAANKVRPVPFYERAPGSALSRALARRGLWSGRTRPGSTPGLLEVARESGDPVAVGVLVCMDSSFPGLARELRRRGARLLVAIADAASIGEWPARQHARMSRVRAVEVAAPVAYVSNTGPTQWYDAHGRLVRSLPVGSAAAGAARLELAGAPPPYVALGEDGVLALAWLPALLLALSRALRSGAGMRFRPARAVRAPGS